MAEEDDDFGFGSGEEGDFVDDGDFDVDEADLAALDAPNDSVQTQSGPTCSICGQEMKENDRKFVLSSCKHEFHRFCLLRNVDEQMRGSARLVCPHPECDVELSLGDSEALRGEAAGVAQSTAFVTAAKDRAEEERARKRGEVFVSSAMRAATQRLTEELQLLNTPEAKSEGLSAELKNGNLFCWKVKLFGFDPKDKDERDLANDLRERGMDGIEMEIKFPEDFPAGPPFCRIVRPKFRFMTGHITLGGSICFELLTRTGWSPTNRVQAIILSIRANLIEGGARLDLSDRSDYSEAEAREAYQRLCYKHGWQP